MATLSYKPPKNLKDFFKFIDKLEKSKKSMGVKVGVLKNSTGINKRTGKAKDISVAEEAYYNCKGVPEKNIPPRNYQQKVIDDNLNKWKKDIAKLLKTRTTLDTCEIMGYIAKDKTQETINTWKNPPNAPATIEIKGKNTPLVDFGDLLKSITFEVFGGIDTDKEGK